MIQKLDELYNLGYKYRISYGYCEIILIKEGKVVKAFTKQADTTKNAISSCLNKIKKYEGD